MANFIITKPGTNFVSVGDSSSFVNKVIDVSSVLSNQLPAFVKSEYPKFIAFLEAYYEWLEKESQPIFETKSLILNHNIDETVDAFIKWFKKEYLVQIPDNILSDKRLLLKHIKEFYVARGTEKSYKLLFRILFDKDVDFYYPARDMLRLDEGTWVRDQSIRVVSMGDNIFNLELKEIMGLTGGAKASVDRVVKMQVGNYEVYELFLNPKSVIGTFVENEVIQSFDGVEFAKILPIITGITLTDAGEGYSVGDIITFTNVSGIGAKARVKSITPNGGIKYTEIINPGINYTGSVTVNFPSTSSTATGEAIVGNIIRYPGYYLDEDGQLDTTKFLQDDYYYQQFSYVTLVDESIEAYRDVVKKILHPCGLILFGGIQSINLLDLQTKLVNGNDTQETISEIIIQYLLNVGMNLYNTQQKQYTTLVCTSTIGEEGYGFGPTLRGLEKMLDKYLPSTLFPDENAKIPAPNENYWQLYGNTQIKDLGDIVVDDIINKPYKRTNICADPYLVIDTGSLEILLAQYALIPIIADYDPEEDQLGIVDGSYESLLDQRANADELLSPLSANNPLATRQDESENLLKYSEEFTNAFWTTSELTIVDNDYDNPIDGTTNVDLLVESSASSQQRTLESESIIRFIPGQQYIFSVYARSVGRKYLRMQFDSSAKSNAYATFNLDTNTVYSGSGVDYANVLVSDEFAPGWVKCTIAFTPTSNVLGSVKLYMSSSRTTMTYNGDGVSGIHIWGASVRDARSNNTYISTTDLVQYRSMNNKKCMRFLGGQYLESTNTLADYINNNEQTCHIVFSPDEVTTKQILLSDTSEKWKLYIESGSLKFEIDDGSIVVISKVITAGLNYIARIRHDGTYIYISLNGDSEAFIECGNVSSLAGTIEVGALAESDYFNGTIARIILDDSVETGAELSTIFNLLHLQYGIA